MVLSHLVPYIRHIIVIGAAVLLFIILSKEPDRNHEESSVGVGQGDLGTKDDLLFTESELAQYDGKPGSKGLFLVILGHVYDVESGSKHYGPGEAYNMFVGHDASRSFISGEFESYYPELSDVSGLTDTELKSLVKWKSFYDKTYPYRGKLIGRYFNERGELTEYHKLVLDRAAKAELEEAQPKQEYPSCNVEWKEETGTRVWCTSRSGDGVDHGWVGKPRRYIAEETSDKEKLPFCVCVPDGSSSSPSLVPFTNCDASSVSCFVKDENNE
ncbi:neuferricin homolog [Wyeomyia smithii]|uniref:neuferricin homolog n=1 Tax=Wyeomyia smithii TaxID=174621 RepID=UPI002467EDA8|nr:neuferricin homolog [Wyeomyia smithii]